MMTTLFCLPFVLPTIYLNRMVCSVYAPWLCAPNAPVRDSLLDDLE